MSRGPQAGPFARGSRGSEVATAALAGKLGVPVHLLDPLPVQAGDGAVVVEEGECRWVRLPGWMGAYCERGGAGRAAAPDRPRD
jgi:hypothetical protein